MFGYSYAANLWVQSIEVINDTNIRVELSEKPNLRVGKQDGEIKILEDMKLSGKVSWADAKVVSITLSEALRMNTNYSLLNVLGANGSIDFTTSTSLTNFQVDNPLVWADNSIEKIQIISPTIMHVYYSEALTTQTLEFKLLAESEIIEIAYKDPSKSELFVTIRPPLIPEKKYILMFIDLRDMDGKIIEFDTGIYDFTVPGLVLSTQDTQKDVQSIKDDSNWAKVENDLKVVEIAWQWNEDEQRDSIDMNAAPEVSLKKNTINSVAANVSETPDTGAETWVLIFLTIIINSFYTFARRKHLLGL